MNAPGDKAQFDYLAWTNCTYAVQTEALTFKGPWTFKKHLFQNIIMNTRLLVENAKDLQEKMLEGAKDQILQSGPKKKPNRTEE